MQYQIIFADVIWSLMGKFNRYFLTKWKGLYFENLYLEEKFVHLI